MGKASEILFELIEERLKPGSDIEAVDEKIWSMLGETWAVLCSDMSGFSSRTKEFGIIHFLSLIYEMRRLMKPIAMAYNGMILKMEADNLFILFREPQQALRCALEMHRATCLYNENKSTDFRIAVCIGIGYGKVLKLGDEDCFGNEVNLAFKLGEDLAGPGQTLLTQNAYEALKGVEGLKFNAVEPETSRLFTLYYSVEAGN